MKDRTLVTAILMLVLIVQHMAIVRVVDANPFWIFKTVETLPGATPPKITIDSPTNNTVYHSGIITVSFNVVAPLVSPDSNVSNTGIYGISCMIDNQTAKSVGQFDTYTSKESILSFDSPPLNIGNHSLTVKTKGVVLLNSFEKFLVNSNSTVYFSTDSSTTPTPITPESLEKTTLILDQPLEAIAAIGLVIIGSVLALVVYRRMKTSQRIDGERIER